jgi:transcription termination/antitermination protein NusG
MTNEEIEQTESNEQSTEVTSEVSATEESSATEVPVEAAAEESAAEPETSEVAASEDAVAGDSETNDVSAESTEDAPLEAAPEASDSEEIDLNALKEYDNPNLRWYVVHTYSMYEDKAKIALLDRIEQFGAEELFGNILVPKTESQRVLKSGKKKNVSRTSFPGYILVQMELNDQSGHVVRDTPKITGFVGNAKKPRPVSDKEVLRLTSPEKLKEAAVEAASTLSFDKGETVKVIDGAFTNFDGLVDAVMADKMKLRVLVSIFGRETPVELEYSQVKKLS